MPVVDRVYSEKLFQSCRILFGPQVDVGWDFLYYIQLSGLKSAFRAKALHTHPDRAFITGDSQAGPEMFIAAREAYENLIDFIRRRNTMRPRAKVPAPSPPASPGRPGERRRRKTAKKGGYFYQGVMPRRRLMFGEFLFFSGHVSWEALIKSIVWQREQRPRLGDIACQRGWLSRRQVRAAVKNKKLGTLIGQALVQSGHLTRHQVMSLVWRQRFMQKALGEYFVERGFLSPEQLALLAGDCERHNRAFAPTPI